MKEKNYIHARTCVYNMNYHIVWTTKYRRKVLTSEIAPSYIAKMLKGISGRKLFMDFPEIKTQLWKNQLWNNSYFIEAIGSTSQENIQKYIERQKTCQM